MTFWAFLICMAVSFAAGAVYGAILVAVKVDLFKGRRALDQHEQHPQHDPGLKP